MTFCRILLMREWLSKYANINFFFTNNEKVETLMKTEKLRPKLRNGFGD